MHPELMTDGWEPPCGCWELNSGPLKEQSVLLTYEPSLQLVSSFLTRNKKELYESLPCLCWGFFFSVLIWCRSYASKQSHWEFMHTVSHVFLINTCTAEVYCFCFLYSEIMNLEGKEWAIDVPLNTDHSTVSHSLHVDELCVYINHTV